MTRLFTYRVWYEARHEHWRFSNDTSYRVIEVTNSNLDEVTDTLRKLLPGCRIEIYDTRTDKQVYVFEGDPEAKNIGWEDWSL